MRYTQPDGTPTLWWYFMAATGLRGWPVGLTSDGSFVPKANDTYPPRRLYIWLIARYYDARYGRKRDKRRW